MNIRIQNLAADVPVEAVGKFIGASDEIEKIVLGDPGDDDNVIAVIKVNTSQAGANAMTEHIGRSFFEERRLCAQAPGLLTD